MKILLTGGTGYIGSHTAVELLLKGYEVVIVDNLSNSERSVIDCIENTADRRPEFYEADVADKAAMDEIFSAHGFDAAIHFAGLKAVGESVQMPVSYYRNNLDTTLTLLETMSKYDCKRIVFSSSATVYGETNPVPFTEDMPVGGCTNPYGRTKYFIEEILKDAAKADEKLSVVLLRYFNPIGAHESGLIGEKPSGIPNNLMPYITQTAAGWREKLSVFGNDYPTHDGTGVRDYIHVVDLAKGHAAALDFAFKNTGVETFNLGTGIGYSVLDVVNAFENASGIRIPYEFAPRRSGDIAECYADTTKAAVSLGWKAEKNLTDMCRDAWNFQKKSTR